MTLRHFKTNVQTLNLHVRTSVQPIDCLYYPLVSDYPSEFA